MKTQAINNQNIVNNPAIQIIINTETVGDKEYKTVDEKIIALGRLFEMLA